MANRHRERAWLDTSSGAGHVLDAMTALDYDIRLCQSPFGWQAERYPLRDPALAPLTRLASAHNRESRSGEGRGGLRVGVGRQTGVWLSLLLRERLGR